MHRPYISHESDVQSFLVALIPPKNKAARIVHMRGIDQIGYRNKDNFKNKDDFKRKTSSKMKMTSKTKTTSKMQTDHFNPDLL